jgi:hypothetical protein
MRSGWDNRQQAQRIDDVEQQIDYINPRGKLASETVTNLKAIFSTASNCAQITFAVVSLLGLDSLVLLRNTTRDPGTAQTLQSWGRTSLNAMGSQPIVSYSDADPAIVGKVAYYWVKVVPVTNPEALSYLVGPQSIDQSFVQSSAAPSQLADFDASHAAGSGGFVQVSVNATVADLSFASLKIYVTGYQGNAAAVAIAQQASTSFSFQMYQTGETVTLKAVAVSGSGVESPLSGALTKALTLNGSATVPSKPMSVRAAETQNGVQLTFPASPEATVTQYKIYRAARGAGFGSASSIGTVTPSGSATYTFLDTNGLGGVFEWYVLAHNTVGDSASSSAAITTILYTSADLPPNVPTNQVNFATVDSIDNGTNATIRAYGVGGVGSSWTKKTGYGATLTFPSLSQAGFTYNIDYYVMYNALAGSYVITTSYPDIIPDGYHWAGQVHTVSAGGGGGTTGGGGSGGGVKGCVEDGTPVEYPEDTISYVETKEFNNRWIHFQAKGHELLSLHPRTLVAVWKRAEELKLGDLLDVSDAGDMAPLEYHQALYKPGVKVKRIVLPSHQYRARRYRLHNLKIEG